MYSPWNFRIYGKMCSWFAFIDDSVRVKNEQIPSAISGSPLFTVNSNLIFGKVHIDEGNSIFSKKLYKRKMENLVGKPQGNYFFLFIICKKKHRMVGEKIVRGYMRDEEAMERKKFKKKLTSFLTRFMFASPSFRCEIPWVTLSETWDGTPAPGSTFRNFLLRENVYM